MVSNILPCTLDASHSIKGKMTAYSSFAVTLAAAAQMLKLMCLVTIVSDKARIQEKVLPQALYLHFKSPCCWRSSSLEMRLWRAYLVRWTCARMNKYCFKGIISADGLSLLALRPTDRKAGGIWRSTSLGVGHISKSTILSSVATSKLIQQLHFHVAP